MSRPASLLLCALFGLALLGAPAAAAPPAARSVFAKWTYNWPPFPPNASRAYIEQQLRERARFEARYRRNMELALRYPHLAPHLDLPPVPCAEVVLPAPRPRR